MCFKEFICDKLWRNKLTVKVYERIEYFYEKYVEFVTYKIEVWRQTDLLILS